MIRLQRSSHLLNGSEMAAWAVLIIFVLVAIFAPYLANEKPYFIKQDNQNAWPVFNHKKDFQPDSLSAYEVVIFAPIPFDQKGATKIESRLRPPGFKEETGIFKRVHWLGTEKLGRDVAAGIVYGCRKSIWIAFLTMTIAALVGIIFGASAGYWGNRFPLNFTWFGLPTLLLSFYVGYLSYYGLISVRVALPAILFFVITGLIWNFRKNSKKDFPLDIVVVKLIEVFQSIPALLLLMVIAAVVKVPSIFTLAWLIGLVRWTSFARYTRAEVLKIKARDYITAARVSGLSSYKILTRYIMPEAFGPLVVIFAFGISSVVLLESTLSFLGIGIPLEEVTWGTLLSQARSYPEAWWLAVFPGSCIFLLVLSLTVIGNQLKRRFDLQD